MPSRSRNTLSSCLIPHSKTGRHTKKKKTEKAQTSVNEASIHLLYLSFSIAHPIEKDLLHQ